jgi:transcriptional regulator with XRE-family HTH domain
VARVTLGILLKRLRELRRRHGLSQEAFAERARMSYKYYQAVEAGRKRNLRLSTLEKLAAAYGLEVWQLLSPSVPKTTTLPIKRR